MKTPLKTMAVLVRENCALRSSFQHFGVFGLDCLFSVVDSLSFDHYLFVVDFLFFGILEMELGSIAEVSVDSSAVLGKFEEC